MPWAAALPTASLNKCFKSISADSMQAYGELMSKTMIKLRYEMCSHDPIPYLDLSAMRGVQVKDLVWIVVLPA